MRATAAAITSMGTPISGVKEVEKTLKPTTMPLAAANPTRMLMVTFRTI
jgi:hypothetical protein